MSPSSSVADSKGSGVRFKNVAAKKASKSGSRRIPKQQKPSYSAGEATREEVAAAVLARDCETEQKSRVSGSDYVRSIHTGGTGRKESSGGSSSSAGCGSSCAEDETVASGVAAPIRSPRSQGFGATFAQDAAVEKSGYHHSGNDDDDKDTKRQSKKRSTLATTTTTASAKNRKKPRVGAPKDDRHRKESDEEDDGTSSQNSDDKLLLPTSQLTTAAGQMAQNPGMDYSQAVTNAKREYNRRNAARARKRAKVQVTKLRQQAHSLDWDVSKLKESNAKLQAQLDALRDHSIQLVKNLQIIRAGFGAAAAAVAPVPYPAAAIAHSGQPSPNLANELLLAMNLHQDRLPQGGGIVATHHPAVASAQQQQQQQGTVDQQLRDFILASVANAGRVHLQNPLLPILSNQGQPLPPWLLKANATGVCGTNNNTQATDNNASTTNDNSRAATAMLLQMLQNALCGPPPQP